MALMWALSTPHTVLANGSPWELSHPISNCESQRLSFQVFRIGVEMQEL